MLITCPRLRGKSQLESGWALASVQFTRAQCLPNKPLKLSKPQYCHLTKILKIAGIIPLFTYDEAGSAKIKGLSKWEVIPPQSTL